MAALIKALILDLDGVIVSTDICHFKAWKQLADEENIFFDEEINHQLRGVSRMQSLEIILRKSSKKYSDQEKLGLTERKNKYYRNLIQGLEPNDILPEIMAVMKYYRNNNLKLAVGSSSKNTPLILSRIGLANYFDAVVDGNHITRSKPDPEVFLKAAARLELTPAECLVFEDADAGVEAARADGFPVVKIGAN